MQPRASGRAAWGDGAEDDAEDDAAVEELRALLMTLLERHPARRATWEDVLDHRFWGEGGARRVQRRPLAPEPAFARLLLAARCEPSEADAIIGLARGTCAPSRDDRKHELSAWAMGDDDIALPSADTELDFRPGLVYAAPPPRSRVDDDVDHDAVLDTNSMLAEDSLMLPDAARAAGGAAAGGGVVGDSTMDSTTANIDEADNFVLKSLYTVLYGDSRRAGIMVHACKESGVIGALLRRNERDEMVRRVLLECCSSPSSSFSSGKSNGRGGRRILHMPVVDSLICRVVCEILEEEIQVASTCARNCQNEDCGKRITCTLEMLRSGAKLTCPECRTMQDLTETELEEYQVSF